MLEDGEIDEEEVDVVESIEISKLEAELAEAQSSGNKRKNREGKSKDKRKRHAKSHKKVSDLNDNGSNHFDEDNNSNHSENNFNHFESQRRNNHQSHRLNNANESNNNSENNRMGFNFNVNGSSNKSSLMGSNGPPSLLGIPVQKPKSLMSMPNQNKSAGNNWSNPAQQTKKSEAQTPKSLFDLFVSPSGSLGNNNSGRDNDLHHESKFVDPVITEKENNKPSKFQGGRRAAHGTLSGGSESNKRKSDDEGDHGQLISIESIEKKMEKKRKYSELQKERQKKEAAAPPKPPREPIICKFFLEGRCQKGGECPFSHNTPLNKKLEPCKFYLNGFCAKNENCLYMHADFPCKFFHRKANPNCIHGDQCRFSHAPLTDPLLVEAFNKHLAESSNAHASSVDASSGSGDPSKSGLSILGSPPRTLTPLIQKTDPSAPADRPPSLMSLMSVKVAAKEPAAGSSLLQTMSPRAQHPSSPPSQQQQQQPPPSVPFKKTLLATPLDVAPSLLNNAILPSAFGGAAPSGDVDERGPAPEPIIPLLIAPTRESNYPSLAPTTQSGDIDERSLAQTAGPSILAPMVAEVGDSVRTEALKQELIMRIMKTIADGDSGIEGDNALTSLPKQTLTELLVKLLNDKDNVLGADVIVHLLSTLGGGGSAGANENSHNDNDSRLFVMDDDERSLLRDSFNESMSNNLQIDLNGSGKKRSKNGGRRRDHDDPYSDYEVDDEYDDDEENNDLVIEGTLGEEMEYKLYELDIEPSALWSNPPHDPEIRDQDQECDPRIKYYADTQNEHNIANYQTLLIEQNKASLLSLQPQTTPTSPSSMATIAPTANTSAVATSSEPVTTESTNGNQASSKAVKNRVADPRLKRNMNNNTSPPRSTSPIHNHHYHHHHHNHQQQQQQQQHSDLISIQTRQVAANSLLSSLPDLHFPKETMSAGKPGLYGHLHSQAQQQEQKGVKLSIEDYKRKLNINKPSTAGSNSLANSITSSTMSILNSLAASSAHQAASALANENSGGNNNNNSLPSIPSYSVNLQAPQSLHELLRNFQSS